jgi:AcrR family transcriptional regulator
MTEDRKPARRKRDPDSTRAAILEAACTLLAKNGPEGLSVAQVAQIARVNRGTAYQHFQTREELLEATMEWVSKKLIHAVFETAAPLGDPKDHMINPRQVAEHLVGFAMENPELSRAWLFQVLNSDRPSGDPFWNQYKTRLDEFARSEYAQPGIDSEVHSVLFLVGTFWWPVWARAHARTAKERKQMGKRFTDETLRLSLYGTMRPQKFPELAAKIGKSTASRRTK